jgi:hypothetical protein
MVLAAGASLDPIQLLLINAGTAGVVVVLILVGWLWAKPSVEREFEKSDTKDKQQQALIDSLLTSQKEVLPLLMEVDKRLIPLMETTQQMMKRVEGLLDRVEREWEWRERRGRVQEEPPRDRSRRDPEDRGRGGSGQGPGPGDYPEGEGRSR